MLHQLPQPWTDLGSWDAVAYFVAYFLVYFVAYSVAYFVAYFVLYFIRKVEMLKMG